MAQALFFAFSGPFRFLLGVPPAGWLVVGVFGQILCRGMGFLVWGFCDGTVLSDHAPVSLCLAAQRSQVPRRGCWIPHNILATISLYDKVLDIWVPSQQARHLDLALFLADRIVASSDACRLFAIARCCSLEAFE